jgi:histidinol phosphatase-like PHP family hydrolase
MGRYLFHLHTTLTDSKVRIAEYFEAAAHYGFSRLIFLEHVRREPTYDTALFFDEIKKCEHKIGIPTSVGFETKLLSTGALDIDDRDLHRADVIGIAEHGFPSDFALYKSALKKAFNIYTPGELNKPVVWVHPGLWLKKHRCLAQEKNEYLNLLRLAQSSGLTIERNLRYGLVPDEVACFSSLTAVVYGVDSHKLEDVEKYANLCLKRNHHLQKNA